MSTVTLKIGPKSYTVACAEGEEAEVRRLGALIAEKYEKIGNARAPLEAQNLLFAALFMADELAEARERAKQAETQRDRAEGTRQELAAEIDTLRKAEAHAREQIAELKAECAELREAARQQHDLFPGEATPGDEREAGEDTGRIAELLEMLAARVEATAASLESGAETGDLEAGGATA